MERATMGNFLEEGDTQDRSQEVSQWHGNRMTDQKNMRISSQCFSSARNFRMNQIYKYDEIVEWNFLNTFEYKTKFIKAMMEEDVKKVIPTSTMENFIPEPVDIMFTSEKQKQRLIFYNQDYDFENNEMQAIMEFKIWSLTEGLTLPDRDEEILRNLYARDFNKKWSYDAMKFKINYAKKNYPILIDNNIAELMNQGMIYIYGRDRCFRPICIINAMKLLATIKTTTNKELVAFVLLMFNYMDHYMFVDGKIENIQVIIDCKDISIFNFPIKLLKDVLGTIQGLLKCKAKQIYCLNVPKSFSVLWSTITLFLDACTVAKCLIVRENTCPQLLAQVVPEQLQMQYGGISKNKIEEFWPPHCPTKLFGHNIAQIRDIEVVKKKHSVRQIGTKGMMGRGAVKDTKKKSRIETELPNAIMEADEEEEDFTPAQQRLLSIMSEHNESDIRSSSLRAGGINKFQPPVINTGPEDNIQKDLEPQTPDDMDGFMDEIEANVSEDENAVNNVL